MRTIPTLIGAAVLLAGLIIGFAPLKSSGHSCGSAYAPHDSSDILRPSGDCDAVTSVVRAPALALSAVGGVVFVVGLFVSQDRPETDEDGAPVQRTVLGRPVGRRRDTAEGSE